MKNILNIIALILIISSFALISYSQESEEVEKVEPSLGISYLKTNEGVKIIKAKLKTRINRKWTPLEGLNVSFYVMNEENEVLLTSVLSNANGIAELQIAPDYTLYLNEERAFVFIVRTDENEDFESTEDEIEIEDISLLMKLEVTDGEKNISVVAHKINSEGDYENISDEDIFFYVPKMFTDYGFEEGYLEDGIANVTFPDNITGDSIGNITVIARLEDHDLYGTVEVSQQITWAIPSHGHLQAIESRELWTPIAPLWMIITLIVMLLGVWGHYFYTIVQIILIRKEGKELNKKIA